MITLKVEYKQLSSKINRFALATSRTREDVTQQALKGMVRYALAETPPASAGKAGLAARQHGEGAIQRDLKKMGFRPVELKGKRPENPLFADPDAFHRVYLEGRAIKMLFFVDRNKFNTMVKRLFEEVGKLMSGWISAAVELNIPLTAWIYRHAGEGRGNVSKSLKQNITTLTATNHVPDKATGVYTDMLRRKAYWVRYAGFDLDRQLKAKLAGQWEK
ncbi:MAG TPA: hypothetical protein VGM62_06220 [Chthoniobacterales bacterium]